MVWFLVFIRMEMEMAVECILFERTNGNLSESEHIINNNSEFFHCFSSLNEISDILDAVSVA